MPERQCKGCKRQEEWGCHAKEFKRYNPDTKAVESVWKDPAWSPIELDGEELWNCPRQHLRENPAAWNRMFLFYGMYKQGYLPDTGAVSSQSHKAIDVFRVFDEANFECDEANDKKRREMAARDAASRR